MGGVGSGDSCGRGVCRAHINYVEDVATHYVAVVPVRMIIIVD